MTFPLAVVLPEVGIRSETFIRRHVLDLVPGGCVVVTDPPPNPVVVQQGGPDWNTAGPVIDGNPGPRDATDPPPTPGQIAAVARAFQDLGVEVVLVEYLDFALRWLKLAERHGLRLVVHGHGVDLTHQLQDPEQRRRYPVLGEVANIVVPTEIAKNDLAAVGLPAPSISVIPYGVDVPDQPPARRPREEIRCVAAGRLVAKKSPSTVITAFALARRACPTLRLDYVGDGPLRDDVRALVEDLDLRSDVRMHGALRHDETLDVIRSADIFLHGAQTDATGDAEGLPLVILEAMAAGLPVVATDHKGIAEAVQHGHSGYLAAEGDATRLAHDLARLAGSPEDRTRLGMAGWRRARDTFSWERNRRDLLGVLGLGAIDGPVPVDGGE